MNSLKKAFSFLENIKIPIFIYDSTLQLLFMLFLLLLESIIERALRGYLTMIILPLFLCCLLAFLCCALGLSILKNKGFISNSIVFMTFLLFLFYSIYLVKYYVNNDFDFDAVVAFCLFAVLYFVANTIIWHLIFRNKYYAAKVIIMLFVSFFWGLFWCMGFGMYAFVVFAPMCITTAMYIIWCVWRKRREIKQESERNYKELTGTKNETDNLTK